MQKSVILRADGNEHIGLGHFYRCLAIAERLNTQFDFHFAIQQPTQAIIDLIPAGSKIINLPVEGDYQAEAEALKEIIKQNSIDIVVLDGYYFDTDYQYKIRSTGAKLISIDDDQPFDYLADVVINHAEGIIPEQIKAQPDTKKLIGFDYALLRKRFIDQQREERTINKIENIFICFGGADPFNITLRVLKTVLKNTEIKTVHVVCGSAYQYQHELDQLNLQDSRITVHQNIAVNELADLMQQCELAIVPASTIAMEAFFSKMVLITGTVAANQQYILSGLSKYPNVLSVGDFNTTNETTIQTQLNKAIQSFTTYKIPTILSKTDRLVEVFNELI